LESKTLVRGCAVCRFITETLYGDENMFKLIALLGVVAGGAAYGLYSQTDLFGSKCGTCSQAKKSCCEKETLTALPPCCAVPCPSCAANCDDCCDICDVCCGAAVQLSSGVAIAKPEACCAAKATTVQVATKAAACCVGLCAACGTACDGCALCAFDCGACCGVDKK
jgi:hypothetical protein